MPYQPSTFSPHATVIDAPDEDKPPLPSALSLRHSTCAPVPSERQCTANGTSYVPAAQRAILVSLAAADQLHDLDDSSEHALKAALPTTDVAALE